MARSLRCIMQAENHRREKLKAAGPPPKAAKPKPTAAKPKPTRRKSVLRNTRD